MSEDEFHVKQEEQDEAKYNKNLEEFNLSKCIMKVKDIHNKEALVINAFIVKKLLNKAEDKSLTTKEIKEINTDESWIRVRDLQKLAGKEFKE